MSYIRGSSAATPPEKGSFPLDHKSECKTHMKRFLECLKEHSNAHHQCKQLSKQYLECRMNKGLMAKEDLNQLGFQHEVSFDTDQQDSSKSNIEPTKENKGFIGGLTVKPAMQ